MKQGGGHGDASSTSQIAERMGASSTSQITERMGASATSQIAERMGMSVDYAQKHRRHLIDAGVKRGSPSGPFSRQGTIRLGSAADPLNSTHIDSSAANALISSFTPECISRCGKNSSPRKSQS